MKAFEIFKPGSHTPCGGQALNFSEADLQAVVRVYDPSVHEAPIVVGHPKDNHPAYGWIGGFSFSDGALLAEPKQVDPSFAEMVQAGRFKKRSISFYAPGSANHPLKGTADHDTYYPRHVGFLGAAAPAVKGLKDVDFAAADDGVVEFEEDWYSKGLIARLFSGLRDWIIAEKGIETADNLLPKYAISDLERAAAESRPQPAQPLFTEEHSMKPEEITALQNQVATLTAANADLKKANDKLTADFSELTKKQADAAAEATRAGIKGQIEALVKVGKVTPGEVETLTNFAAAQDDAAQTFDFTEGDKPVKISARALFLKQLEARPVAVDFKERSAKEPEAGDPVAKAQQTLREQVYGGKAA